MDKDPVIEYGKSDVIRGRRIGEGSFGKVFEGTLKGQRIAIKVPVDKLRDDILNELKFLAKLKHPNVVHFYGVLQKEDLGINLLFEYLDGDARTFVRNGDRKVETLLGISYYIALGMDYIHDMNIIHRDLAARNVLLDSKNRAKISDFGLSRLMDQNYDHYTITERTIRPWRWIPGECLQIGGRFSKSSDIWSFGVTLWEIWNKGKTPYGNMNNKEVEQAISVGQNPMSFGKPKGIPEEIQRLLKAIFVKDDLRPSFADIKILLNRMKKGNDNLIQKNYSQKQKEGQSSKLKFKAAKQLTFWNSKTLIIFKASPGDGSEDCIFKLPKMNSYENLIKLTIQNLVIDTRGLNIGPANLPNLKTLHIGLCNIRGNIVDTIVTRLFALEMIYNKSFIYGQIFHYWKRRMSRRFYELNL